MSRPPAPYPFPRWYRWSLSYTLWIRKHPRRFFAYIVTFVALGQVHPAGLVCLVLHAICVAVHLHVDQKLSRGILQWWSRDKSVPEKSDAWENHMWTTQAYYELRELETMPRGDLPRHLNREWNVPQVKDYYHTLLEGW